MNAGIADAHNLAWKLAYVLRGEAGPELLESYHAERHPVALMTMEQARLRFDEPSLHWGRIWRRRARQRELSMRRWCTRVTGTAARNSPPPRTWYSTSTGRRDPDCRTCGWPTGSPRWTSSDRSGAWSRPTPT
ncbi:FAD-dependent monooxygenase [Nocardia sp. X0981]